MIAATKLYNSDVSLHYAYRTCPFQGTNRDGFTKIRNVTTALRCVQ